MGPQTSELVVRFQVLCLGLMTISCALHGLVQKTAAAPVESVASGTTGSMAVSAAVVQAFSMAASATGTSSAFPAINGTGELSAFAMPIQSPVAIVNASSGVPATAMQTSLLSYETMEYGREPPTKDIGYTYGNATINNGCEVSLNLMLVGGFRLGGYRHDSWGIPEEQVVYSIPAGGSYSEPYRMTYVSPNGTEGYNAATDRLWGEGIPLKIYWADCPGDVNHTQFEYGLNYKHPEGNFTLDYTATELDWQRKTEQYPGYQSGLTVRFEEACGSSADSCEGIDCAGKCLDIYNFDRSRELEPSKKCTKEYKGNIVLNLCAGVN